MNELRNLKKLFYVGFILVSLGVILNSTASTTATSASTATASITDYVAYTLNANLTTAGINFGGNLTQNTIHNNATNNSKTGGAATGAGTGYSGQISSDTNTALVSICLNGSTQFVSGGNNFAIAYLAYNTSLVNNTGPNGTANNVSGQAFSGLTANLTSLNANTFFYFNFWLTVPSGQSAGTYTGSVYVRATSSGGTCV